MYVCMYVCMLFYWFVCFVDWLVRLHYVGRMKNEYRRIRLQDREQDHLNVTSDRPCDT